MQTGGHAITSKNRARLDRQFDRIAKRFPVTRGFLDWARRRSARLLRIPVAVLLVAGGIFSFLPILGIWMLPLGLMLLAVDVPWLQGPISAAIIFGERWWQVRRRRRRDRRAEAAAPNASASPTSRPAPPRPAPARKPEV